jgi:hypothetical protein
LPEEIKTLHVMLTEKTFSILIQKAITRYHHHGDEHKLFNFFIANQCSTEQATQMVGIAINDYQAYISNKKTATNQIITGAFSAGVGSCASWYSWYHPTGVTSFVFWGVIVFGISFCITGIIKYPKKNLLKAPII